MSFKRERILNHRHHRQVTRTWRASAPSKPGLLVSISFPFVTSRSRQVLIEKRGMDPDGKVIGRFAATGIRPKFYERLLADGIRLRPDMFDEVVEV